MERDLYIVPVVGLGRGWTLDVDIDADGSWSIVIPISQFFQYGYECALTGDGLVDTRSYVFGGLRDKLTRFFAGERWGPTICAASEESSLGERSSSVAMRLDTPLR